MAKESKPQPKDQTDNLAEKAHELMDQLAQEYPHLRQAGRVSSGAASKLKKLEDKLVDRFNDGLRKLWEPDD